MSSAFVNPFQARKPFVDMKPPKSIPTTERAAALASAPPASPADWARVPISEVKP